MIESNNFDDLLLKYREAIGLGNEEGARELFIQIFEFLSYFNLNSELKGGIFQNIKELGDIVFEQGIGYQRFEQGVDAKNTCYELTVPESYYLPNSTSIYSATFSYLLEYEMIGKGEIGMFGCDSSSVVGKSIFFTGLVSRYLFHSSEYGLPKVYEFDLKLNKSFEIYLNDEVEAFLRNYKIKDLYGKVASNGFLYCGTWGQANDAKLLKIEIRNKCCVQVEDITPKELLGCDDIFVQEINEVNQRIKIGIKPGEGVKNLSIGYFDITSGKFSPIFLPEINISKIAHQTRKNHLYIHQWYAINEKYNFVILSGHKGSYLIVVDHEGNQYGKYFFPLKSDMQTYTEFPWQHQLKHEESPYLYAIGGDKKLYRFHFEIESQRLYVLRLPLPFYGEMSAICVAPYCCYLSFFDNAGSHIMRLDEFFNFRVVFHIKDALPVTQLNIDLEGNLMCLSSGRYYPNYSTRPSVSMDINTLKSEVYILKIEPEEKADFLYSKKQDMAMSLFVNGLNESKEKPWAYFKLANRIFKDQREEACKVLMQISQNNKASSKMQIYIADFLFSKKEFELSERIYSSYFETSPNNISIFLRILACNHEIGQLDKVKLLIRGGCSFFGVYQEFFDYFLKNKSY